MKDNKVLRKSSQRNTSEWLEQELKHLNYDNLPSEKKQQFDAVMSRPDFDPDKLAEALESERLHTKKSHDRHIALIIILFVLIACVAACGIIVYPWLTGPESAIFHTINIWFPITLSTIAAALLSLFFFGLIVGDFADFAVAKGIVIELASITTIVATLTLIATSFFFISSIYVFYADGQGFFESNGTRAETGVVSELYADYRTDSGFLSLSPKKEAPEYNVKVTQDITYNGVTRTFDVWYKDIPAENYIELSVGDSIHIAGDLYASPSAN